MRVEIHPDAKSLGSRGAELAVGHLRAAIQATGQGVLLVSTGASQFTVMEALVAADLKWDRVTVLHLDEYVGLAPDHPASFRRYLHERLIDVVRPKRFVPVDVGEDVVAGISRLNETVVEVSVDVALVGVGENAHLAFNDPPADFTIQDPFHLVTLDRRCRGQQVREGWFTTLEDVPSQAVTMTVRQILRSSHIVSCVPYEVKAPAVRSLLESPVSEAVPATALRGHPDVWLLLDHGSASKTPTTTLARYAPG